MKFHCIYHFVSVLYEALRNDYLPLYEFGNFLLLLFYLIFYSYVYCVFFPNPNIVHIYHVKYSRCAQAVCPRIVLFVVHLLFVCFRLQVTGCCGKED